MAGKITVKNKGAKVSPYKVSGSTLAEIWDDIKAKGPKDGGKPRAGYTTAPVSSPESASFDGKTEPNAKKPEEFDATIWFKSAQMTMSAEIQMPSLASDKALSPAAKKEWKRFIAEVRKHEDEHVAETEKEAKAIAAEIQALTATGTGKDKKAAIKAAQAAFDKALKAGFGGTKVQDRIDKVNKALDSGGHGPVLDTSIP